ncbi:MAG: Single-stranded nucleic acid binding R3H protein [uncultured bacterium]|nr:MAG: Single-stranded nucleic acid binding R3H protein [uncultured bacterium]
MDVKTIEIISKTIEELLEKMGFSGKVSISKNQDDDSIFCNIETDSDSNFLIGQHGINLQALQHLARLIVRKHIPEKIRFTLDINNYRQQKNQSVVQQAHQAAQEALDQGRAVMMHPMSTYERRIVHMELSKNSDVVTESIGEGEHRKIVVKPANIID